MAALTADFGGTRIKLGMVEAERVIRSTMIDAQAERGLAFHLPKVREAFESFAQKQGRRLSECSGVGLAVPCVVTPRGDHILATPKDKYADAVGMDLNHTGAVRRSDCPALSPTTPMPHSWVNGVWAPVEVYEAW